MAKPRIFISSTFFDLRQIRVELDRFIENMGYEPIRNEEGDIPYGKDHELQDYCYKEIDNIDILISIIGSRYGSKSNDNDDTSSVSQKELKTAIERNKQVFIFIDKNVLTEFETYELNKENKDVSYKYVDDVKIYNFIEEIKHLRLNNNIHAFETTEDITRYLKEQFAGLFKQYILDAEKNREQEIIRDINDTAKVLKDLVDYLKADKNGSEEDIKNIIKVNHPLVARLKKIINIPYNFYIEGVVDLNSLLYARGYRRVGETMTWEKIVKNEKETLIISEHLFKKGNLVYVKPDKWLDDYVIYNKVELDNPSIDLPF